MLIKFHGKRSHALGAEGEQTNVYSHQQKQRWSMYRSLNSCCLRMLVVGKSADKGHNDRNVIDFSIW